MVCKAIGMWLSRDTGNAGLVAFLALAGSDPGRHLLLGQDGSRLEDQDTRRELARHWRRALTNPNCEPTALNLLTNWGALARAGALPEHAVIELAAETMAPGIQHFNALKKLGHDIHDGTFWNDVLDRAITAPTQSAPAIADTP
jgi:hypothetical protein